MNRNLCNRRVLLTGASSGIGRALGVGLAQAGARLIVVARTEDKLSSLAAQLKQQYNANIVTVVADLAADSDRKKVIDRVAEQFGRLDILINNAGVTSWAHFADSSEEILRRIMEVNFFAPAELTRLAIRLLANGEQPAVVNVASMCGRRAMPAWPEYSASKYALCGMTEALRGELVRYGVDILLMLPGLTQTGLHDNMLKSAGRAEIDFRSGLKPHKVAAEIIRAIRHNRTETVIGSDARWMLLAQRFFPRMLDRLLARKVRSLYAAAE